MNEINFKKVTPESVGATSKSVLDFYKTLDELGYTTHSLLMARGNDILTETYYAPFHKDYLHRAYSVSKSFVAIAIGLLVTENLISLSDVIIDYFPEYRGETTDEYYDNCTVLDMLKMSSNLGTGTYWWGKFKTRTEAYYSQKTSKMPGSLFFYDSIGSFVLGNIVEKVTGKNFLEYLKEKVFLELGFSKDSYVLTEPGGYAVGDSAVMCTLRDFLIFARFIAKKGNINGKQYINREFMENAIKSQSFNDLYSAFRGHETHGYGYLIWIIPGGFALLGLGDQLVFYNEKLDFTFVVHADNQGSSAVRDVLYHELYNHFIPKISLEPISENKEDYSKLIAYENGAKLIYQYGETSSPILDKINGVTYKAVKENTLNFEKFGFNFNGDKGTFFFRRNGEDFTIDFGLGHNEFNEFSFGERAKANMMGVYEEGKYKCANSGAWVEENTFVLKVQVIDTYFGKLQITVNFSGENANLYAFKRGQYVFDGIDGYVIAKQIKE